MATAKKKSEAETEPMASMTGFGADAFKEGYERFTESLSTLADFQRSYMEAFMVSSGAVVKGFERLTSEQTAFAKAAFEDSISTAKAASASSSVQEAVELNGKYIRASLENNMNQMSKVTEICVETAKESSEPITEQYNEFIEKVQAFRP